ncbi:DUF1440 domain-containing protein [Helicobacter suis]|uniref:DUF1440 domain-containing protein n=1 Tax=Helicobacter suis TaxID=104628 RepID=UPI0013D57890|nr:DUF1440 domain-containing protein [Helicobacter suis]
MLKTFLIGIVAGVFGAIVKWGWEVPFPPRNPHIPWPPDAMQRITPPQILLEQLHLPTDWSYTFSGIHLPLSIFIVHVGFSITFAILYCLLAEKWKIVSVYRGAVFGFAVYILAHVLVMPLIAEVPPLFLIPFEENLSELFGHIVWLWSIEIVRCDLKSRFSQSPTT